MTSGKPLKVAILWHMHQPMYREPFSDRLVMPWVRFHSLKDYLDMPLIAAKYENVRITFNLVPSLIDQIALYANGGTDPHLELSRISADDLSDSQRQEILETFFSCPSATMIEPYERYNTLHRKARDSYHQSILPRLFTAEELRDLQVWSNLVWIDPHFRDQEPVRSLIAKAHHFTESEKQSLLDWQIDFMKKIVPTYQRLYREGRIDVSFTPYYHPILPLLCDTDIAKEAVPNIALPSAPFRHPEDAEQQIRMSQEMFQSLFGKPMQGMWPSEGSVSPEVIAIAEKLGIRWLATDEEILDHSWRKSGKNAPQYLQYRVNSFGSMRLFFRDHALSDRIGFVYSGWEAGRAVDDFMAQLKRIRQECSSELENTVVPIILDGENAWEYYQNDGTEFLHNLCKSLNDDPLIETVTMTNAAQNLPAVPLPALFAGSWINHNFRVWIGHDEDNRAWNLLSLTRGALSNFQKANPDYDADRLKSAWRQIYIAEGSDWCWWYGDDHRGANNAEFDVIYRRHLAAVFEILGLDVPAEIRIPIHRKTASTLVLLPENQVTPEIDGRLTHFYEWAGAGSYDCKQAGTTMHRVERIIDRIFFAYNSAFIYVRLDFADSDKLGALNNGRCIITLKGDETAAVELPLIKGTAKMDNQVTYAVIDICEVSIRRDKLFANGAGKAALSISVFEGNKHVESWPENDEIQFNLPEPTREMFWPT
jgi:alpha-amylase/alpha-mannosidase (GH57 family)